MNDDRNKINLLTTYVFNIDFSQLTNSRLTTDHYLLNTDNYILPTAQNMVSYINDKNSMDEEHCCMYIAIEGVIGVGKNDPGADAASQV